MISYGNPNIFFANIGRGDVGIAPYNRSINWNLQKSCRSRGRLRQMVYFRLLSSARRPVTASSAQPLAK